MPETPAPITAVVLAGGQSRRMAGRDKARLPLSGRPMIEHVIERLAPQVTRLLINRSQPQDSRHPCLSDLPRFRGMGPMAGIHAALSWLNRQEGSTHWLLCAPCDTPQLPPDLAHRLASTAIGGKHLAAVAHDGVRRHPTCCLLHPNLLDPLETALLGGEQRLGHWLTSIGAVTTNFSDQPAAFVNINTPEQLAALTNPVPEEIDA